MAVRFGSNNRLGQRLMAAGASPDRAQRFIEQRTFEQGGPAPQMGTPVPQRGVFSGAENWYDEDKALNDKASRGPFKGVGEGQYSAFFPPQPGESNFKQYVDVVLGKNAYDKITAKETKGTAPLWQAASRSQNLLDQAIVQAITVNDASIAEITETLLNPDNPTVLGGRTPQQAVDYAEKVYGEYIKFQNVDVDAAILKELVKDKDYKFNLPSKKLTYGLTTDLKNNKVSILSSYQAAMAFDRAVKEDPQYFASETRRTAFLNNLLQQANKAGMTPWKEAAGYRDYLKGKKVKP